jgi:hypothetical protein
MAITSKIRRHKIMEQALRDIMGSNLPPSFKCGDTYDSIVFPAGYTVPSYDTVIGKFYELLALEDDEIKTSFKGDLEVGTANLYVDVSASSVGIGISTPSATLQVVGNVHASSDLQVDQVDLFVEGQTGNLGIGITEPDASLHVEGDVNVSSDFTVGTDTLHVDTQTRRIGIKTKNPVANLHVQGDAYISSKMQTGSTLKVDGYMVFGGTTQIGTENFMVQGNAYISSNLQIDDDLYVYASTGKVGIRTNQPHANVHVVGETDINSNLTVGTSNLFVDANTGNTGIGGVSTPETELHISGRKSTMHGDNIFDFEDKKPKYITSSDEFRFLAAETLDVNCVVVNSGTTVYEYNPSNGTTTTAFNTTTSNDTTGIISVTAGREYYADGPFNMIYGSGNNNHAIIPFSCSGRYFGFKSDNETTTSLYMYAPYGDVTVKTYANRKITETASNTISLTKKTLFYLPNIETSSAYNTYVIEAVNGPILVSVTCGTNGASKQSIIHPASDLVYCLTKTSTFTKHDPLSYKSSFQYNNGKFTDAIMNYFSAYSKSGIPLMLRSFNDQTGNSAMFAIPYEILGDTYYIPHSIIGFNLCFTEYPQSVTVEYMSSGSWTSYGTFSSSNIKITPYTPEIIFKGQMGNKVDSDSDFDLAPLAQRNATLWKFTSNRPFALSTEASQDEYMAVGWLNPSNEDKIYRLPYSFTPSIFKVYLDPNTDITTIYTTFTDPAIKEFFGSGKNADLTINYVYGAGYTFTSDNKYIEVPCPGTYRLTSHLSFYSTEGRLVIASVFVIGGTDTEEYAETSYMRHYENHNEGSNYISTIVQIKDDRRVGIGLIRRSLSTTANTNNNRALNSGSFVMIEKIG